MDLLSAWSGACFLSSVLWGFDRQSATELAVVDTRFLSGRVKGDRNAYDLPLDSP